MPRRKSSRRKRPEWTRGALLDWTTGPTQLRDSDKKPAHKVCAEAALDQQAEEAAAAYYQHGRP